MNPVVIRHPLDLTGRNPDNLVIGERHGPFGPGNRVFVLKYGAFYANSLVLRDKNTGAELLPNVDFKAVQTFIEPTLQTGKLVCAVIQIEPSAYNVEFDAEYQVLGGDYSLSTSALEQVIEDLQNDDRTVRWGDIVGKPDAYAPTPHLHDIHDVFGWQYVVASLEAIRQAILMGDVGGEDDFYGYVDMKFGEAMSELSELSLGLGSHVGNRENPHNVTKQQLGLGNVGNYAVASSEIARANLSNETLLTPHNVKPAIEYHTLDTENPHQVSKSQVGLGNVDNFITASLAMALEGKHTESFTTPFLVAAMIANATEGEAPAPVTPPRAQFTWTGNTNVLVGERPRITFTNTSVAGNAPISAYAWNFGNGTTSSVRNPPAVDYTLTSETQSFVVGLTVTAENGLTNSTSQTLTMRSRVESVAPDGFKMRINGTQTGGSYPSIKETDAPSARHSFSFGVSDPTNTSGPFEFSWWGRDPQTNSSGPGEWSYTGRTPPTVTADIAAGSPKSWSVEVTVRDQSTGLSAQSTTFISAETRGIRRPVADFSLSSSSTLASSSNSTLVALLDNNSSFGNVPSGDQTWVAMNWSFGVSGAATLDRTDFSPPQSNMMAQARVEIRTTAVGSGTLTVNLVAVAGVSLYESLVRSRSFTYVRQPPSGAGPTAFFTGDVAWTGTNSRLTVTNQTAAGSTAVVSWDWTVVWGSVVQQSSARHPPSFVGPPNRAGCSVTLQATDAAGLSHTYQRTFSPPT